MRSVPAPDALAAASEEALMQWQRDFATMRRHADAGAAAVAGELARRSDPALGYDGLAVRVGARTVEKLVSNLAGISVAEARNLVSVGSMDAEAPWLSDVAAAVASGGVGVGAAAAIRSGLGEPNADVDAAQLRVAAERLAREAVTSPPERIARAARFARDELDAAGVADREAHLREKRYLRLWKRADGMTRIEGLLDPASAALVTDAFDRITMPRRRGVRFLDPAEKVRRDDADGDSRTIEQLMLDGLVQLIRLAAATDDGSLFGVKSPGVRVHVRLSDLRAARGAGYAEGQHSPVSITTVQQHICGGGIIPILFDDDGNALNVGRRQRLFTDRQRIAIAARDGGCMMPDCDRPPSWTEAHHIRPWDDGGRTDIGNGVALCTHHHLWVHNTGGRITHRGSRWWLHRRDGTPPKELVSKHPLRRTG
jgi:hypothetical protein